MLKDLRNSAGLQQKQLAEKLGVTQATINGYESGKREPRIEMLIKIAALFNVTIDFLIDAHTEKPSDRAQDLLKKIDSLSEQNFETAAQVITALSNDPRQLYREFMLSRQIAETPADYKTDKQK